MSYYLQDSSSSQPIVNVSTVDLSNITVFNLSVLQDASVTGNVNIAGNLVVPNTVYCTNMNAQNEYRTSIIATSNCTVGKDLYLTGILYHPRTVGNNLVNYAVLNSAGMMDYSNLYNAPSNITTADNLLNQIGGIASGAGSAALTVATVSDKLKSLLNPYDPLANGLDADTAGKIQDSLSGSNESGITLRVSLASNVVDVPFSADQTNNIGIPNRLVMSDTSSIVYDSSSSFGYVNRRETYSQTSQKKILDVGPSILYVNTFSNVNRVDLSNITINNDGTIRRSLANSNAMFIDGISFNNGVLGSIKNVNASNISSPNLSNVSTILGQNTSNLVIQTGSNFSSNNFVFSPSGVLTAPTALNSPSNYTNFQSATTISNLQFNGSNASFCNLMVNNLQTNLFSFSNNQVVFNGDVNIKGVLRANWMSLFESFPQINTSMAQGIYLGSRYYLDSNGFNYFTAYDKASAQMGTRAPASVKYDSRVMSAQPFAF